jgi:hypothetical protein
MLLVAHKGVSKVLLGYVADYCNICHGARCFRVESQKSQQTMYGVETSSHDLGVMKQCGACGISSLSSRTLYASFSCTPEANLPALIAQTFPNIWDAYPSEFAIQAKLSQDPALIAPETRQEMITVTLATIGRMMDQKVQRLDKHGLLRTLLVCAGPAFLLVRILENGLRTMTMEQGVITMIVLTGIFLSGYLINRIHEKKKMTETWAWPIIDMSIAPLKPSRDELGNCYKTLSKAGGSGITRFISVDEFLARAAH